MDSISGWMDVKSGLRRDKVVNPTSLRAILRMITQTVKCCFHITGEMHFGDLSKHFTNYDLYSIIDA